MTASQDFQNWLDDYVTGRVRAAVGPLEEALADSAETVSAQALIIADRDRQVAEQAGVIAARDATIVDLRTQLEAKPIPAPVTLGTTKPTAENTGVNLGKLERIDRDLVIAPGDVYEGVEIFGRVTMTGGTLRRFIVHGKQGVGVDSMIDCTRAETSGVVIENGLLDPTHPSASLDGVRGHDFTLRRVRIRNVVDHVGVYNPAAKGTDLRVVLEGNLFDELAWWTGGRPEGTHNDNLQVHGGLGVKSRGNTYSARYGNAGEAQPPVTGPTPLAANPSLSCVMFNANQGATGGHAFVEDWFDFGYLPVNCGGAGLTTDLGLMHRCRFNGEAGMVKSPKVTVWRKAGQKLDVRDCTLPDGAPIFVRTNG